MIKMLLIAGLVLLSSCSRPSCTTGKEHEWGKWQSCRGWEGQSNEFGQTKEFRRCENCGLTYTEMH